MSEQLRGHFEDTVKGEGGKPKAVLNRLHQSEFITDAQKKELDIIASNPFINQAESDYINLWKLSGTEPAIKKFIDGIKPLLAKREQEQIPK